MYLVKKSSDICCACVSQEKYQIWIEFQLKLILQKYNKNDVRSMHRNNENEKNIEKSPTRSLFDYNQK